MTSKLTIGLVGVWLAVAVNSVLFAAPPKEAPAKTDPMAVLAQAAKAHKYVFALFWKNRADVANQTKDADNKVADKSEAEADPTDAMRKTLAVAMKKLASRAETVEVNVGDDSAKAIVKKFGLEYAPFPLLLAIAPNGAVTAGFPESIQEKDIQGAFATPGTEKCLKAFQDDKLVFICVQNSKCEAHQEALQAVRDFQRDERFAKDTEIVMVDPAAVAEKELLDNLGVDPKTKEAVTIFFAPPTRRIGSFVGETSKDELVATLLRALSGFS